MSRQQLANGRLGPQPERSLLGQTTNDCILTIDTGAQTSEHYVPSLNSWVVDGNVPVVIYGYGAELGAGFLLPNGKVFYIGGSTNTAIYTPGASTEQPGQLGGWAGHGVRHQPTGRGGRARGDDGERQDTLRHGTGRRI